MGPQMMQGKIDGPLEVFDNGALVIIGKGDHFVQEIPVPCLGDVLIHRGEKPHGVVRPIMGMARGLDVAFLLRRILMAGIVVKLDQGQARAMMHLGGEHEADALLGHLRVQMNNALYILHGVAVSVAVALARVYQAGSPAPDKGDIALEGVPGVHHGVQVLVRGMDLQGVQLAVPMGDELFPFGIHGFCGFLITLQQRAGLLFALLAQ